MRRPACPALAQGGLCYAIHIVTCLCALRPQILNTSARDEDFCNRSKVRAFQECSFEMIHSKLGRTAKKALSTSVAKFHDLNAECHSSLCVFPACPRLLLLRPVRSSLSTCKRTRRLGHLGAQGLPELQAGSLSGPVASGVHACAHR